jgi:hypothetical protein
MTAYAQLVDKVFVLVRRRRMKKFFAHFSPSSEVRLLDIGGEPETWTNEIEQGLNFHVTQINLEPRPVPAPLKDKLVAVRADATALPYADNSFDIAFSNSVIEHVGGWERQELFAREARRVASKLWVQTPAREFPVEPHLVAPLFHYLPKKWQRKLVRLTPRALMTPSTPANVLKAAVEEIRLLSHDEFKKLFPDCRILKERFLGLTKCYIAVRT